MAWMVAAVQEVEESFECGEKGRASERERQRVARATKKKRRNARHPENLTNHGQDTPADLEELIGEDGSAVAVAERGKGPREGRKLILGRH